MDEISLGDTVGTGVPADVSALCSMIAPEFAPETVVWHFHDTFGTALANVAKAFDRGYTAFDSATAGLGGCPYAPGASGNLATEDLVYFLERSGVPTQIDLDRLCRASEAVLATIGRQSTSKARAAQLSRASTS